MYLIAARRKIEIAEFHYARLQNELRSAPSASKAMPSIPIQAYFEGAILSVIAAIDQVAQAINSSLKLGLKSEEKVSVAFATLARPTRH